MPGQFGGNYVQLDETAIRYLAPGHGQTRTGYLWTANRPGGDVFYQWHPSRAGDCLRELVPEAFAGVAQSDGYGVYKRFAEERGLIQAGCWAHARRGFYQSREESPRLAGIILRQIGKLYAIEGKHPGNPFTELLTRKRSGSMPPRSQAVALALAACQARGVSSWTRCTGHLASRGSTSRR